MQKIIYCVSFIAFAGSLMSAFGADYSVQRHAGNFEITDQGTHRILSVTNAFRNSTQVHRYALVPRGAELPKLPEGITVIRTPVQRVVAMETVHVGYIEALQQLDALVATATTEYITHPQVRQRIAKGQIQPIQSGQAIDIEKLLLLQPDLILTSVSGDATFDLPAKLERTGLPIVLTAGYMEQHPLARAEWIKFIAAFFEEAPRADQIFERIEQRYTELTRLTGNIEDRPTVLCGAPYSGVWHVPGGASFTARTIQDAGGHYLWSDDTTQGGIPLDTERVFLKAARADYWINPSFYTSMDALLAADARFAKFDAARKGAVYNNTRQVLASGGNAIWESGIVHPEDVLADLIHIFHPELLPAHELIYYQQLNE